MLTSVLGSFVGGIVDSLIGKVTDVWKAYINKEITEAELREKMVTSLMECFAEVEKAHADALAKTFASFMDAVKGNPIMQKVWGAVVISQLVVLLWHQLMIPWITIAVQVYYPHWHYPSSGSTVDWAYLLVGGLCGLAPLSLGGPSGRMIDSLKNLIPKK